MNQCFNKWVEVDLDALAHNLAEARKFLGSEVRLIAVVKADAYGLGAVEAARTLAQNGVDYFAVTLLEEALDLRRHGIERDILVFAPLNAAETRLAVENNCTITACSLSHLEMAEDAARMTGRQARLHIKVDTGLGRLGALPGEVPEIAREAKKRPGLTLEGIYTHFAEAGGNGSLTREQFRLFTELLDELEKNGISILLRHCCGSSAFLKYSFMHLDAVRLGTILTGQYPIGRFRRTLSLQETYAFKARIISVREIKKGSYVGYFRTYRLRRDAFMALLPVGFSDGLGVEPSPKPSGLGDVLRHMAKVVAAWLNMKRVAPAALIQGRHVPVRGKVFMQFCLLELPKDMRVNEGDTVVLPVRRTLVSGKVARIYLKEGEPAKIEEPLSRVSYTSGEE